ncbi:TlyA family RNA methyltransferase [Tessaracoccus flavus]|uniref:TlyA family rRNA (Cytidine-2'-O)-methyltransferase n=1 Tax=Tessaracoccus flavus TaxID=1610493 RepID=A0A1Q2CFC8_9ACTN|nr:TlyA family RNA methyltransferase [Tessaracoccus flavus]AQP44770.1 TlyA family rRNA (cytidine-2'-O)-methyltransferase [Tessaracoccus flavus]SDZ17147.1 23S rRNA (cytidine1920-2'-O)/16S rRNA (cytidine1409-2'-O)-methyltransferase [Tessaracoccus flavus]
MRLDLALVERGLARSRTHAASLIREGLVSVNGKPAGKASQAVGDHDALSSTTDGWVSRAAHKLIGALDQSGTAVPGRVLDAGASTGGFTQVCLERGAETVYAVDVGHGQLVDSLQGDPRVRVREGLNLRDLTLDHLDGHPVDLIVGDVSFISLSLLLPSLAPTLAAGGSALLLVKPQFEVGRERLGSGGIVRDPALRVEAVDRIAAAAAQFGWREVWRGQSVLPGSAGNVEYFIKFTG